EWCDCGHASGLARLECLLQPLRIQLPPDEDQAALAPFAFLPRPLMVALDDHVDALHDIALRIILEGDDALEPQDVGPVDLRRFLYPGEELLRVHFPSSQRNRSHAHIVDRGESFMMVVVMVIMIMIVMVMIMIMVAIRAAD